MLIKEIIFPHCLEEANSSIDQGNIDVFVTLEGEDKDYTYNVTVATPQNIEYLMNKDKMNYFEPGYPFIIVKELTLDIVTEAITAYASKNEAYWLKLHHFAGKIGKDVFDKLRAEHIKSDEELEKLYGYQDCDEKS